MWVLIKKKKSKEGERDTRWNRDETLILKQGRMMKAEQKTWHQAIKRNQIAGRWN